jgi:putative ABC transport system substrate-binding protein
MRRRDVITLPGGAAAALPLAVRAQQPAMPLVGYLSLGSPERDAGSMGAFRQGLSESGFVEGRNVAIEYRWAQNDRDHLPELTADLMRRRVAVIVSGGVSTPLAAKAMTTTIPIVFSSAQDPVQAGLVASLNRPGGNVTGVTSMTVELMAKQLGLLRELLPRAVRFAVLVNPNSANHEAVAREAQAAAQAMGWPVELLHASTNREIDAAFAKLLQLGAGALLVAPETLFGLRRAQILTLAARHAVPTIYNERAYAGAGGLMSYGPSLLEQWRQVGLYAARILKSEKPGDLPVMRPTKFEFIVNLQTARTLDIEVPPTLIKEYLPVELTK